MSNDLFKPHKTGSGQDRQQDPPQEPAASGISLELLEKIASLLKDIETMNGKIADNYDVVDEMRDDLIKLRDQLQNIKVPEARLDDESREFISSASDTISSGVKSIDTALNSAGDTIKMNIEESAKHLSKPLDDLAKTFETRIGKVVEKKVNSATNSITASKVENWVWRILALTGLIALCMLSLYPKIKEIDYPHGAEGFFWGVVIFWAIIFALYGIYKLGKANSNSWY